MGGDCGKLMSWAIGVFVIISRHKIISRAEYSPKYATIWLLRGSLSEMYYIWHSP